MFFNPVVLLEFRRIVQEEEMICDDIAISETKNPLALAETLKHFYHPMENTSSNHGKKPRHLSKKLEEHSQNLLISSRIARLERGSIRDEGGSWVPFTLTAIVISMITYFVL